MKRMRHIFMIAGLLAALLAAGCADDDRRQAEELLPQGYGRLAITISTPEAVGNTRAVSTSEPWLQGTADERAIKSYHLLICQGNTILQAVSGGELALSAHEAHPKNYFPTAEEVTSDVLPIGTYNFTFYCLANFTADMVAEAGLTLGNDGKISSTTLPANFETQAVRLPLTFSGSPTLPSTGMPMTGKLTANGVAIGQGTTTITDGPLILWRMMAKLEFRFTNLSAGKVRVEGIEVDPVNLAGEGNGKGIYLISQDDLTLTDNGSADVSTVHLPPAASADHGAVRYQPAAAPLTLDAKDGADTPAGNVFFYVNESDATFTTTENQYSLRFKVAREESAGVWRESEFRYGVTTVHQGTTGGFNVIRRNDWIHIPVTLTDWQLRLEAMPFVPIAGYPAVLVGSDGLTATFSTGGFIILQPFVRKNGDTTWRDFSDPQVTFQGISWKNSDGTDEAGDGKILTRPFAYDAATQCITGQLSNSLPSGTHMTTLTISVKLGDYDYSFTCNIIVQK